ncbi:MAG: UDP-N-acetylglucosamine--N-acetylmuramyl-(pentapeptide) pyrophosphoryl-undecaprenol N-acetylglucosamine transferase [Anaerolineales bacterium]
MRLLICAGGTGGGVYPALAAAQAIPEPTQHPLLWVGGKKGMEAELVQRAGLPYVEISAAGLHGVGWRALPGNLWQLWQGMWQARHIVRNFAPDVILLTGGFVAYPMALAARLSRPRPRLALYVPDIEPGLALKQTARFADLILVTAEESRRFFAPNAPVRVTGYPVRHDLLTWTRPAAQQALGLQPNLPTLLVFGGSKGARSINRALTAILPQLLLHAQVVHISGTLDWAEVQAAAQNLPANLRAQYHPFPYLHAEMGAAFRSADVVVARAGASTLGEFPLFGLPAILVPYPYAWRYQKVNAEYLAQRGAAMLLPDERLQTDLLTYIQAVLFQPDKLAELRAAMQALAQPNAARSIATSLLQLNAHNGRGV